MADVRIKPNVLPRPVDVAAVAVPQAAVPVQKGAVVGHAPLERKDVAVRVEVPHGPPNGESRARVTMLRDLSQAIAATVRAYPAPTAFVRKAFADGNEKAIGQVLDAWAGEAKVRGVANSRSLLRLPEDPKMMDPERANAIAKCVFATLTQAGKSAVNEPLCAWLLSFGSSQKMQSALPAMKLSRDEAQAMQVLVEQMQVLEGYGRPSKLGGSFEDVLRYCVFPDTKCDPSLRLRLLLSPSALEHCDHSAAAAFLKRFRTPEDVDRAAHQLCFIDRELANRSPAVRDAAFTALFQAATAEQREQIYKQVDFCSRLSEADALIFARAIGESPCETDIPPDLAWHRAQLLSQRCSALSPAGKTVLATLNRVAMPFHSVTIAPRGQSLSCREEVVAGGLELFFVDGTHTRIEIEEGKRPLVMPAATLVRVIAQLPRILREQMPKVVIVAKEAKAKKDFVVMMDATEERINVYPYMATVSDEEVFDTLIHEAGHTLSFARFGRGPPSGGWSTWIDAVAEDKRLPSGYSEPQEEDPGAALHEDFAEAMVLYTQSVGTRSEAALRTLYPARFAALDCVFGLEKPH